MRKTLSYEKAANKILVKSTPSLIKSRRLQGGIGIITIEAKKKEKNFWLSWNNPNNEI